MRSFALVLFLGIGFGIGTLCAGAGNLESASGSRQFKAANAKRIECYIMLIRLRHDLYLKWKETGKWPDDKEANAALGGHGQYWQERLKEGAAIMAGGMKGDYWDNVALIVFGAASEEKANEIVKNDPAVKAKVFQAQVRPFDVHWLTNKFHP